MVHDIKVIQGDHRLFIAMPSRKTAEGDYRDIAHPINSDTRKTLQDAILDAFDKAAPPEDEEGGQEEETGAPAEEVTEEGGFTPFSPENLNRVEPP